MRVHFEVHALLINTKGTKAQVLENTVNTWVGGSHLIFNHYKPCAADSVLFYRGESLHLVCANLWDC